MTLVGSFIKRLTRNYKGRNILEEKKAKEEPGNLTTGGEINVLDLIDYVTKVFEKDKTVLASFMPRLKPDFMRQSGTIEEMKSEYSDFCLLRLLSKVVKQGKDMKFLFETLDEDKSGQSRLALI